MNDEPPSDSALPSPSFCSNLSVISFGNWRPSQMCWRLFTSKSGQFQANFSTVSPRVCASDFSMLMRSSSSIMILTQPSTIVSGSATEDPGSVFLIQCVKSSFIKFMSSLKYAVPIHGLCTTHRIRTKKQGSVRTFGPFSRVPIFISSDLKIRKA